MNIFDLLDLVMKFKDYRDCSVLIKLENDDFQDFDLRWEQALLLTSDPPSDIFCLQVVRFLSSSDNYGTIQ